MTEFQDVTSVLTAMGVIATAMATVGIWYYTRKDRRPTFSTFQRKKENGVWFIHIHSPSKPIRKCNVIFKGEQLPLRGEKGYEKSVALGGGCNFDMSSDVSKDDDGFVIVREGKKKLEKEKFNKMETPSM